MAEKDGALEAGEDADDKAGSGAPAGESDDKSGSEFNPPKDGSWIPKARFDEAIGSLKDQIRDLSARLEAAPKEKPAEPAKRFTRTELNAAVAAGQMTQEQADQVLDEQIRAEAIAEARRTAEATVAGAQRKEHVTSQLARYKRIAPEILQESSDIRARIAEEFGYLVGELGEPRSLETELKAIRAVLGPVDRLEQSRSGRSGHETHAETGGGGSGHEGGRGGKKFQDTLDANTKKYYEKMIDNGYYKDWASVEKLVSGYTPPKRRRVGNAA